MTNIKGKILHRFVIRFAHIVIKKTNKIKRMNYSL
jgi:hypothetical protein